MALRTRWSTRTAAMKGPGEVRYTALSNPAPVERAGPLQAGSLRAGSLRVQDLDARRTVSHTP